MGLGKTGEVLALILNDRPDLPAVPKRLITLLPPDHPKRQNQQPSTSGPRDAQAETANGLVCSDATLVTCAVSLVGQWVAEAKERAGGSLSI
jgi:SNF2 family DNA or RNA helicase